MTNEISRRDVLIGTGALMATAIAAAPRPARATSDIGARHLVPKPSSALHDSPWGIWTNYGPVGTDAADQHSNRILDPSILDLVSETGVKLAYVGCDWPAIEQKKGAYDFEVYDAIISGLLERGVHPYVQLYGSSNAVYGMDPQRKSQVMTEERFLAAWLTFIEAVVRRSRGKIAFYEIWNEPNAVPWFWDQSADPAGYARMVREVSKAVHRADPGAKVLAGPLAMVPLDFVQSFLATDSGTDWSGFSYHPYGDYPEHDNSDVQRMQAMLAAARGGPVPVYQTECGDPSNSVTAGFRGYGPWSESIQARWLLRRMLNDYALGARCSVYFLLRDLPGVIEVGPDAGKPADNTKGLITANGRRKPAFRALQNLCSLVDSRFLPTPIKGSYTVELDVSSAHNQSLIQTLALTTQGKLSHFIYWAATPLAERVLEGRIEFDLPGITRDRHVRVDLLTGEIHPLTQGARGRSRALAPLPLHDYPVALVSRDLV